MKRIFAFLLFTTLCPFALAQQDPGNIPVLRTGTRVVSVDVVVTDATGKPVRSLPGSAFHVFEDGHPENIQDFTEHRFQAGPPAPPQPPLGPGVFTNAGTHSHDTLNVVVLDTLNTRPEDQMYVHKQVEEYLSHARPGAQIALLELTTHLILLQSFTSDPQVLISALKNAHSIGISPLLGSDGGGRGIAETRARMRDDYTADGFRQLNDFLSHIPGKKNVIYFSDGNSHDYGPDGVSDATLPGIFEMSPESSPAEYLVSASQTSFSYIDAHGLGGEGAFSAEHRGGITPGGVERANALNANRYLYAQEFAEAMGGQAFLNTNDLAGAMGYAIVSGSNYYTFDYHPSGYHMDGGYHRIRVSLDNPAYHLAYRQGYNATVPQRNKTLKEAGPGSPAQAEKVEVQTPIGNSMQRGWPEMTQILYREGFVPLGTEKGGSITKELAPGSTSDPKMKPEFRNFNLTFTADTSNIQTIVLPNGRLRMRVEFIVLTYDNENLLRTAVSKELDGDLTAAELTNLRKTGLQITVPFSTPAHGDYYVRTGIQDKTSDNIGTLEVPKALIENLPALDEVAKKK